MGSPERNIAAIVLDEGLIMRLGNFSPRSSCPGLLEIWVLLTRRTLKCSWISSKPNRRLTFSEELNKTELGPTAKFRLLSNKPRL